MTKGFAHLHAHSPFSFLDGASPIEELVRQAADLEVPALAITDHDNLSGAVRFVQACSKAGIKPVVGCELTLQSGHHLTALADSPDGYANLCRLLTAAHLGHERGKPRTMWADLVRHRDGLLFLSGCRRGEIPSLLHRRRYREAEQVARRYARELGRDRFLIELQATELPGQHRVNRDLAELADHLGLVAVATGNVHYATQDRYPVHDVLRCIAAGVTLEEPHPARPFNDQLHLIPPSEMRDRFAWYPAALTNTVAVAERCQPALVLGRPRHPRFAAPPGETAQGFLRRLVWEGAQRRYGRIGPELRRRIEDELAVIDRLGMADYFLIAWDVVQFARRKGIRASGRGSAADSVVAYCLGLTDVDAFRRGLRFERFLSVERGEPPDIDIDFDAGRRDEVAAYVYRRYGHRHVAAVATYHTYRARGALREVGKVLGMPEDVIDSMARRMPHLPADAIPRALDHYPELRSIRPGADSRLDRWLEISQALAGLPRHLGTHSSGLVIAAEPLADITPLQRSGKGVVMSQFDKDDVEALGLMKLDLLFLRMLGAVNTAAAAIRRRNPGFDYDRIPHGDHRTYRRIQRGETVGAFQLESPAQRALHPRLRPRGFEDIVASVALIRPGPIKGDMVRPFIARRNGQEPVTYIHPKLRPILEKTYGVVLFQEQVIEIAREIAGFTPGEADALRRAMSSFRSQAEMDRIGQAFIAKAVARGCAPDVARTIFGYIAGYAGYGFCEAHAASFATIAYKTAYLLEHYPAEFYAALLSHQPMGYYPPNTLIWEAKRRGVPVLGPCVNRSGRGFEVEDGAIRVGLGQIRTLSDATLDAMLAARARRPFSSLDDFCRRVEPLTAEEAEQLVLAGAFDGLHPNRRALLGRLPGALHRARRARDAQRHWDPPDPEGAAMDDFPILERDLREYHALGLTVERHLMHHWRAVLSRWGARTCDEVARLPRGHPVTAGGLSIRPHRPPTKSGRTVVFLTLEDETGLIDVTVFEDVYMRFGQELFVSPGLLVSGYVERQGEGVSIVAKRLEPLSPAARGPVHNKPLRA
ncbi:MAG: DNA polymerase III subunit alpha [Firmicutes bacterium]|nr:DNA polymerase III subunit alpha [Bacillota bacterium]